MNVNFPTPVAAIVPTELLALEKVALDDDLINKFVALIALLLDAVLVVVIAKLAKGAVLVPTVDPKVMAPAPELMLNVV
jgi:hypothetical protein